MQSKSVSSSVPSTPADFDRAYRAPLTLWGDVRVPPEVKALAVPGRRSLELGCGVGRFTRYLAEHGVQATGVDWSAVAVEKAQAAASSSGSTARYLVADVTRLEQLSGPFDFSFDVGCFHCLDLAGQRAYAAQVGRLLAPTPRATHLIWALDRSPSDLDFSAELVARAFEGQLVLREAKPSRRRVVRSHWYWLTR